MQNLGSKQSVLWAIGKQRIHNIWWKKKKKEKIKLYNNACVEIGVNLEFKFNILPYI